MRPVATWVLVVPEGMGWLAERVAAIHRPPESTPLDILPGAPGFCVLVDREPGSEGLDEHWAAALSAQLEEPVLLVRCRESAPAVWRYLAGRFDAELEESPERLLARHGVRLPRATA